MKKNPMPYEMEDLEDPTDMAEDGMDAETPKPKKKKKKKKINIANAGKEAFYKSKNFKFQK